MKRRFRTLLAPFLLLLYGCGPGASEFAGEWRGTVEERGRSIDLQLTLRPGGDSVEGSLQILSETGQDLDRGRVFPVVQSEVDGGHLRFLVPVAPGGKVTNDALSFDLELRDGKLVGRAREQRDRDEPIPVSFERVR